MQTQSCSTNRINIFTVSSQLVPTFEFPISVYKGKVNTNAVARKFVPISIPISVLISDAVGSV